MHNITLNIFSQKYAGKHIPGQIYNSKKYVYQYFITKFLEIGEGTVNISIAKTTDVEGRYVINVLVGLMHEEKCFKSYLLTCEELSKWSFQTVEKLFHDSLNILGPNEIKHNKVFYF